ncbi:alpha/beta fold hydrolase [Neptunomonas sp.]|uniref:alpha/beta hydrolase n=1 Tax=Neptunomonas sp. TaxID=1971898 RepID=UPI0025FA1E58|nr:alpha/beta fold hydrolase [Neptunomonas sp.]
MSIAGINTSNNRKGCVVEEHRGRLRDKLDIHHHLSKRECLRVGELSVHCELYEADKEGAPVLVFLPGIGTYSELYADILGRFAESGFHTVGMDYPGHGYSGGKRGHYTVEGVVESVSDLIDRLEERFTGPVYLFGYSIGSLLAVAAAERDSRIQGVMCGTLLIPEIPPDTMHQLGWQWTWGMAQMFPSMKLPLKSLVDYEQLLAGHPAAKEFNHDHLMIFDYPLSTLSSLYSWRSKVKSQVFDFHAAILHGADDDVMSLGYSKRLVETLAHPFELIEIPGGHMLPWYEPELLIARVTEWLNSLQKAQGSKLA